MGFQDGTQWSDAARRLADAVNLHVTVDREGNTGRWLAARLSDGVADATLYDTREEAVRYQLHEQLCVYVCIPPTGMPYNEAETLLNFTRAMYDAGYRMPDPAKEIVMPTAMEQLTGRPFRPPHQIRGC
jgi:hypothetical protein